MAAELTGWPEREALGRPLAQIYRVVAERSRIPQESSPSAIMDRGRFLQPSESLLLVARDGTEHPIEETASWIRSGKEEARGCVVAFRDVHERREAELQLRESEKRFRLLADAAPVLIWVSGPDKRCTWFNERWLEFVGRPLEREIGDGWAENVHPEDFERCLRIQEKALGPDHPFTALTLEALGNLHRDRGDLARAQAYLERCVRIAEPALGAEHPDLAYYLASLANVYRDERRFAAAEPLYRRALAIFERALGAGHPSTVACRENYEALTSGVQ